MAAIDEPTRPLPSRRSQLPIAADEDDTAKAVARTMHQTTSGIFMDTGKKFALTTQRKIPMPKIFRTKSSDSNTSGSFPKVDQSTIKWSCVECRYENVDDGNPICCLCGSSRTVEEREAESAVRKTSNSTSRPPPAQSASPKESLIVPVNPFDQVTDYSFEKLQINPSTNATETREMRRGHSFDDSWYTPAPVARSRINSSDSHSLPDDIVLAEEPKKPPRRRNKSTDNSNPLPMFQSPDYLPPLQIATRLNGNGGPTTSMSKPTRIARRFLFGRRRASTS